MSVSAKEWKLIAEYYSRNYPPTHKNVGIPQKCVNLHLNGQLPSDKQLNLAKEIREAAYLDGFDFVE
jgi:hypothetical protein